MVPSPGTPHRLATLALQALAWRRPASTGALLLVATAWVPAHGSHTAATALGNGGTGAIVTDSAVPLEPGQWSLGTRYDYQAVNQLGSEKLIALREADPDADLHSVKSVTTISLTGAYGLTENFTLGFTLPYVDRNDVVEPEEEDGEIEISSLGDSNGIGDLKVYGLWRFFGDDGAGANASLLAGLSTPTGKDDAYSPEGERLEQEFQPGSGAWDPFAGVAYSQMFGRYGIDVSSTYTFVNEGAQDTNLGDLLTYNAAVSYALTPDASVGWGLVLELNGLWRDQLEQNGDTEPNSGGNWLSVAPGITITGQHWGGFLNVGYPVINEPKGDQDKQDWRILVGFRYQR
jgi:hypothetical protein